MKPLRIGLVGLQSPGGAAISDALQTIPGVEPIAIADEARAIASMEIDAVVISATSPVPVGFAEMAAAQGKHVLFDAPLLTPADADRLVSASRKVKVMMSNRMRFLPAIADVRAAIQAGGIGRLVSGFYSTRVLLEIGSDAEPWPKEQVSWGLLGQLSPAADLLRHVAGKDPVSVVAAIGSSTCQEMTTGDYVIATFAFASGAKLTLEAVHDATGSWRGDRAAFTGREGDIELRDLGSLRGEMSAGERVRRSKRSRDTYADATRGLLIEFRDAIAEDREPSASAADGRAALEMILAAQESVRSGRRVALPFNGSTALPRPAGLMAPMRVVPISARPEVHAL
jgi:predicted dehydrogenase